MITAQKTFSSPKTHGFIPYAEDLIADALIQTTLEPNVHALKFASNFRVFGEPRKRNLILVQRREGLFELGLRRADEANLERLATRDNSELRIWWLKEENVLATPKLQNARTIWASRDVHVSVHLRMSILSAVSRRSIRFKVLVDGLDSFANADQAILHLAWVGALQFKEDGHPIGPSSLVSAVRA
ncbi:MAG: hypothetical protein JZU55_06630 [Afipia sp.]|nr:hypothetical protein [Afipia sp.]